jgi:hypothetical protein
MQTSLRRIILPLAAAAALSGLTGCYSTSDRTAGRALDDHNVNGKVKHALHNSPVYKFEDVIVTTHNGVVQLSGWANTEEQKTKAGEIASRVDGVHDVINNISLKLTPTGRENGYYRPDTNNPPARTDAPIKGTDQTK